MSNDKMKEKILREVRKEASTPFEIIAAVTSGSSATNARAVKLSAETELQDLIASGVVIVNANWKIETANSEHEAT